MLRFTREHPVRIAIGITGSLIAGLLIGCGGGATEEPEVLPAQTMTRVTPQLEPPPPPPPLPVPPIRELQPTKPTTVKVIDPGEGESGQMTLIEASRRAKEAKRNTPAVQPIAEINDENLAEYASGGDLIIVAVESAAPAPQLPPPAPAPTPGAAATETLSNPSTAALDPLEPIPAPPADGVRDERYWRNRALELRMGWRRAIDQIDGLELESAALRQQFYAEENPYVRDSQIKPAWDRILDRLDQLRDRSLRYEQQIDLFIEDGRRSGAEQGWLNEGWELEPDPDEKKDLEKFSVHKPVNVPSPLEDNEEP